MIQVANQSYPLHRRSNRSQVDPISPSSADRRSNLIKRIKPSRHRRVRWSRHRSQLKNEYKVNAISATKESHTTTNNADPVIGDVLKFWSLEELHAAQKTDTDISYILTMMETSTEKPPWYLVTSQTYDVLSLLEAWPRLKVWNGILLRRFESPDSAVTTWQVILPKQLRREFLFAMVDGHLSRKRTATSIQALVYWPTWSSDMNVFWNERRSGKQHYGEPVPRDSTKSCINESISSHEVNKTIDVEMGFPLDEEDAVTTLHVYPDESRDGVDFTYRPIGGEQHAGVVQERYYVVNEKVNQFGIEDWMSRQSVEQLKKCCVPTPISWVSAGAQ